MLLSALGFWEMGQIALIAAYTALIGAILMLILSVLGVAHLRRVRPPKPRSSPRSRLASRSANLNEPRQPSGCTSSRCPRRDCRQGAAGFVGLIDPRVAGPMTLRQVTFGPNPAT